MGHIQRRHLSAALTVVPPEEIMHEAGRIIAPMLEAIINNRLQSRTLAETRDTLLPKLISGQVRVERNESPTEDLT